MSFCQTCSSEITPRSSPFITPCCSRPICEGCLGRNPRLREYIPCLQCGDQRTTSSRSAQPTRKSIQEAQARERERERERAFVDRESQPIFELGDEEEYSLLGDSDHSSTSGVGDGSRSPPPGYEADGLHGSGGAGAGATASRRSVSSIRSTGSQHDNQAQEGRSIHEQSVEGGDASSRHDGQEMELVEVRHAVQKGDTILSISRKYAADPHEVLHLNNLPHSVLSTQPHLLRTRRTILISQRLVPKSQVPSTEVFSFEGDVQGEPLDKEEERKRERERALKRFQLLTKNGDKSVGEAYIALSELDEGRDDLLEALEEIERGYEVDGAVKAQSLNKEDDKEAVRSISPVRNLAGTGKKVIRDPSNREERAIEAFFDDEQWEKEVGGVKRHSRKNGWKSIGEGSHLGIKV